MKSIFQKAYDLIKEVKIKEDFNKGRDVFYLVKDYSFKIYLKTAAWFTQCGCRVGMSNTPGGLCKHHIAVIVKRFLKENDLELVKKCESISHKKIIRQMNDIRNEYCADCSLKMYNFLKKKKKKNG